MAKLDTILKARTQVKGSAKLKMEEMGKRSMVGGLTSFAGVFSVTELKAQEKDEIAQILKTFAVGSGRVQSQDFEELVSITSEVKAINNQAAILHGERIKT